MSDTPPAVEVYREEKPGAYLPAKGTGTPCYHVYAGGTWYELYDFTGEGAVTVVPYGPTANREALGRRCGLFELPARIAAQVGEIERRARVCAADPCPGCDGCPPEGAP